MAIKLNKNICLEIAARARCQLDLKVPEIGSKWQESVRMSLAAILSRRKGWLPMVQQLDEQGPALTRTGRPRGSRTRLSAADAAAMLVAAVSDADVARAVLDRMLSRSPAIAPGLPIPRMGDAARIIRTDACAATNVATGEGATALAAPTPPISTPSAPSAPPIRMRCRAVCAAVHACNGSFGYGDAAGGIHNGGGGLRGLFLRA